MSILKVNAAMIEFYMHCGKMPDPNVVILSQHDYVTLSEECKRLCYVATTSMSNEYKGMRAIIAEIGTPLCAWLPPETLPKN